MATRRLFLASVRTLEPMTHGLVWSSWVDQRCMKQAGNRFLGCEIKEEARIIENIDLHLSESYKRRTFYQPRF